MTIGHQTEDGEELGFAQEQLEVTRPRHPPRTELETGQNKSSKDAEEGSVTVSRPSTKSTMTTKPAASGQEESDVDCGCGRQQQTPEVVPEALFTSPPDDGSHPTPGELESGVTEMGDDVDRAGTGEAEKIESQLNPSSRPEEDTSPDEKRSKETRRWEGRLRCRQHHRRTPAEDGCS